MKRRTQYLAVLMMSLFFLSFTQGCILVATEPGPDVGAGGDLRVTWLFDDRPACPGDVESVEIQIDGVESVVARCTDGFARVNNLAPGAYVMSVVGRDFDGVVTWTSATTPFDILVDGVAEIETNLLP
ncbi:MAG: hypothetical protein AAGJ35_11455 [Myxococcota bacterium]